MPIKVIQNNGICQAAGCSKLSYENRKYCTMHRQRFIRHKSLELKKPIDRLLERIIIDSNNCWNYTFFTNECGYGNINVNGVKTRAHRLSYTYFKGEIPNGLFICHKCDNPSCVNPDHLYAGTQKENVRDMFERGRDRHTRHKLAMSAK